MFICLQLVNDYVRDTYYSRQNITGRDVTKLNVAACRLTLDLMPGLEMSVVFQVYQLHSICFHCLLDTFDYSNVRFREYTLKL